MAATKIHAEFLLDRLKQHGDEAPTCVVVPANVAYWLEADFPAMSPVRPLYPRKPTFERQRPLFDLFRPLHLQERTYPAVPPFVCF